MSKKKRKKTARNNPSPYLIPVRGILVFSLALTLFLSLLSFAYGHPGRNWLGLVGYNLGWFFHASFGFGSYFLALFIGWIGWRTLFNKSLHHLFAKAVFVLILIFSCDLLLGVIEYRFPSTAASLREFFYPSQLQGRLKYHLGGALSWYLLIDMPYYNLHRILGSLGVLLIFSCTGLASCIFLAKIHPAEIFGSLKNLWKTLPEFISRLPLPAEASETAFKNHEEAKPGQDPLRLVKLRIPANAAPSETHSQNLPADVLAIQPEANPKIRPSVSGKEAAGPGTSMPFAGEFGAHPRPTPAKEAEKTAPLNKREAALAAQKVHNGDFSSYRLPPEKLLTVPKKVDQNSLKKDLKKQAEVLEETLQSFGIEAKVGQINCGPTITSFEVHPAIGVKVQKIKTLENDIALNMEAKSIRIIAPIPGKAAVGMEVPNPQPQEVAFIDMLAGLPARAQKIPHPHSSGQGRQWRLCDERPDQNAPLHYCRSHRIGKIRLHQYHYHVHPDERKTR